MDYDYRKANIKKDLKNVKEKQKENLNKFKFI